MNTALQRPVAAKARLQSRFLVLDVIWPIAGLAIVSRRRMVFSVRVRDLDCTKINQFKTKWAACRDLLARQFPKAGKCARNPMVEPVIVEFASNSTLA